MSNKPEASDAQVREPMTTMSLPRYLSSALKRAAIVKADRIAQATPDKARPVPAWEIIEDLVAVNQNGAKGKRIAGLSLAD